MGVIWRRGLPGLVDISETGSGFAILAELQEDAQGKPTQTPYIQPCGFAGQTRWLSQVGATGNQKCTPGARPIRAREKQRT